MLNKTGFSWYFLTQLRRYSIFPHGRIRGKLFGWGLIVRILKFQLLSIDPWCWLPCPAYVLPFIVHFTVYNFISTRSSWSFVYRGHAFSSSATMIKIFTSLFPSDFKSVFVWHLTGKVLSFKFYPKAVFFECKFRILWSAIVHVQNWPIGLQRVESRLKWRQGLASLKLQRVTQLFVHAKHEFTSLKIWNSRAA